MSYSNGALAGIEPATCKRVAALSTELQGTIWQLPDPDTQCINDACVSPKKTGAAVIIQCCYFSIHNNLPNSVYRTPPCADYLINVLLPNL